MAFDLLETPPETKRDYLERFAVHGFLVFLFVITAGPYLLMVSISLMGKGWTPTYPPKVTPEMWSLVNYAELFSAGRFEQLQLGYLRFMVNSTIIAGGATLIVLIIDSLAGYAFARLKFAGRDITFALVLSTMMIPPMALFIPTYILFTTYNLTNSYIGIILPHVISGFGVFLMRQFILTLPSSLEDAALIDGCSKFGVYWRIVLPMMKPALATLGIITFITTWNSFLWPLVLASKTEYFTLTVAIGYFQGRFQVNWAATMAAATITMVPVVIVFLSLQDYYVRGYVIGGLKG